MSAVKGIFIEAAGSSLGLVAEAAELALAGVGYAARQLQGLSGDEGVPTDFIIGNFDEQE